MADCHDLFQEYLTKITLSEAKRRDLRGIRNANRRRIKKYFRDELKRELPLFFGQGSYMMRTTANPLNGEYDIDDGVYLQGLGTDESTWPAPETVHGWIVAATAGFTDEPPQDKATCIRVRYAGNFHLDLPIYAMSAAGVPKIFVKGMTPFESDPRGFTEWFCARVKLHGQQLCSIVRYLKGWRDYQQGGARIASGLALTILAANHLVTDERDDVALVRTVAAIYTHLELGGRIAKPVVPYEDLAADWTPTQRANFLSKLKNLRDRGQDALDEEERSVASGIWNKLFGGRFVVVAPDDAGAKRGGPSTPLQTARPAILPNIPVRSA